MTDQRLSSTMDPGDRDAVHGTVRERYAGLALRAVGEPAGGAPEGGCCGGAGCCASEPATGPGAPRSLNDPITAELYDVDATAAFPGAAAASLGCGNPTALATLSPGQTVLDLGSGGGLDVLLSARRVAPGGRAYGLDMTPEMLGLARRHQREAGIENAEFLLGTIDAIPLPDAAVDVVISNCVINLAPDKDAVLAEAFRVLRPGGIFAVSDIVLLRRLPDRLRQVVGLWTGCVSGALLDVDYLDALRRAGFTEPIVDVTRTFDRADLTSLGQTTAPEEFADRELDSLVDELDGAFASAFVRAVKPS